jgi:hypothetical protein
MGTKLYSAGGDVTQAIPAPPRVNLQPGTQVPASVSPSGGQDTDDVPANLNVGEFIIPRDTTHWLGEKFFQNLIKKSREDKLNAGAKPAQTPPNGRPTFQHPAIPARQ